MTDKNEKYLLAFAENLNEGINYYYGLFADLKDIFEDTKSVILNDLDASKKMLHLLNLEIENLSRINSVDSFVKETVIPSN